MSIEIFIGLCIILLFSIIAYEKLTKKDDQSVLIINQTGDSPEIRKIKTYFFTNDRVDFEKFCDYILCIKDNMSLSEYCDMMIELELFVKCVPDLLKEVFPIILYSPSILEFSYKDFKQMQSDIRDNKYSNNTINFIYILIVTMLYLKETVAELRDSNV